MTHLLASGLLAKSGSSGGGGSPIGFFVIIAIFVVVYLVFLRPMRSRQKAAAASRGKAQVGDRITTTAGLIATVVAIDDDEVTLEVAPGVFSQYLPQAILRVIDETTEDEEIPAHEEIPAEEADAHDGVHDDEPTED